MIKHFREKFRAAGNPVMSVDAKDDREYKKGMKVSDSELRRLNIERNTELSNWNYTIKPAMEVSQA